MGAIRDNQQKAIVSHVLNHVIESNTSILTKHFSLLQNREEIVDGSREHDNYLNEIRTNSVRGSVTSCSSRH